MVAELNGSSSDSLNSLQDNFGDEPYMCICGKSGDKVGVVNLAPGTEDEYIGGWCNVDVEDVVASIILVEDLRIQRE